MAPKKIKKLKRIRHKKLKKNKGISLKPQGPVNQISAAAGVRYHDDYVYDQLRYTILTIEQMSKADRELVTATLKPIVDGPHAMTLPRTPGWSCITLDQAGRALLVCYKGIEVALFYKRQLTDVKLQPGDRFPEGVMQDPIDAWQRLDLIGQSAKKANIVLSSSMSRKDEENSLLKRRLGVLDELNDALQKENQTLTTTVKNLEEKLGIRMKRKRQRERLKEKKFKKRKR